MTWPVSSGSWYRTGNKTKIDARATGNCDVKTMNDVRTQIFDEMIAEMLRFVRLRLVFLASGSGRYRCSESKESQLQWEFASS